MIGPYCLRRAKSYVTITQMRLLQDRMDDFGDFNEYLTEAQSMPLDLELKIRYFSHEFGKAITKVFVTLRKVYKSKYFLFTESWDYEKFGECPSRAIIFMVRFPSANRSW